MLNDMDFKLQKRKLCTIKNKSRIKTHGVSNRFWHWVSLWFCRYNITNTSLICKIWCLMWYFVCFFFYFFMKYRYNYVYIQLYTSLDQKWVGGQPFWWNWHSNTSICPESLLNFGHIPKNMKTHSHHKQNNTVNAKYIKFIPTAYRFHLIVYVSPSTKGHLFV